VGGMELMLASLILMLITGVTAFEYLRTRHQ
jgi:hypothetical protein